MGGDREGIGSRIGRGSGVDREKIGRGSGGDREEIGRGSGRDREALKLPRLLGRPHVSRLNVDRKSSKKFKKSKN